MCVSITHILPAMAMPKPASCSNNSTVNGGFCNYLFSILGRVYTILEFAALVGGQAMVILRMPDGMSKCDLLHGEKQE